MLRTLRGCLLAGCVLVALSAAAAGQEAVTPEKRAAIARLLAVEGVARRSNYIFTRLVGRFREPFTKGMIAGLREKGFFKGLSAAEEAELERRIGVFFADVFRESTSRMAGQIGTAENWETLAVPVLARHFTLDELNESIRFDESPLGQKLLAVLPELLAESAVAKFEESGIFDLPSSPEAMSEKLDRFSKERAADAGREAQQLFARLMPALEKQLSVDERKELAAVLATPSGRKYAEAHERVTSELVGRFYALHGRQTSEMLRAVYDQKLNEYAVWLSEASRPGAQLGAPPPSSGRVPPSVIVPQGRP